MWLAVELDRLCGVNHNSADGDERNDVYRGSVPIKRTAEVAPKCLLRPLLVM